MKKGKYIFSILISFIFILGIFSANIKPLNDELIINAASNDDREFKSVWVTPLVGDVNLNGEQVFKTNMIEVLDIMEYYGLNAMFFHVRTHNNALYPSSINPKATYVSNINFNNFDPIAWLIEETHSRGIEFHAWMNPYRYNTSYQTGSMPSTNPQASSSNTLEGTILNPALNVVKNHIYNTVNEFINRYPTVDSIHFDDYFYVSTSAQPTSADARRGHVNELIEGIHTRLATFNATNNRHIQLGISPTGIYKNGNGTVTYDANGLPITTGSNSRGQEHYGDYLYADTLKWIKEGWLDYIVPQVYWARDLSAAPFVNVLSWWDKVVKYLDVNLYTGIGLYKSLETGGAGWYTNDGEMNAQYNIIENDLNNVLGYTIFSFKHLKMAYYGDTSIVGRQVNNTYNKAGRKSIKVLPEVRTMTPVYPNSVPSSHGSSQITWNSVNNAKFYYIYASSGTLTYSSNEIIGVVGDKPGVITYNISGYNSNYNYGIRALSPTNHLSPISTAPPVEVYNITYNLNGGSFDTAIYETREEMIVDFLTDFYEFVNPAVNLNTFMHGPGKTSGFDGLYDGDYFDQLFKVDDKSVNPSTNKFINQPEYNKWVPLLDLMDEYTNKGRPPQTFWGSVWTAAKRIKPFIRQENLWEEDGEPKASTIMEIVNRIPAFDNGDSGIYYQYTKNFPDIILPEAEKEGYRFLGWYTSNNGGTRVTVIPSGSTGNKTFYARFELIEEEIEEVLVTFNLYYEDKFLNSQTIKKGTYALHPATPIREHYSFDGWYLDGSLFDFGTPIYNDVNLVAKWTFSSYIVKFFDYNGTLLKEQIVAPGASATSPSNPSRTGYTFSGWDKSYKNVYSNLNVYAEYSIAKYFVEFVDSDGSTINSYLVDYGSTVSEPIPPVKPGLSFLGWYLDGQIYDFNAPVTSDIVIRAWYDTLRYTVTFLNENGSVFTTSSVEAGSKVTRPANNPYNDGYSFNAWTLNGSVYNFNNSVNSNLILKPTWDILVHTVRFLNYDYSEINRVNVNHGSKVTRPANPVRFGYSFKDWYLGDLPYIFNYAVYEDTVLIANWDINKYTVKFLDYDGSVLSEQSIAHGSGAIAPSNPNNKLGHVFAGWDRSYNNIVSYTEVTAVYDPVNLFVEFIDDDLSHINTILVGYGFKVPKPSNPYKPNYIFAGWLLDGILFDFDTIIYEDITLTASYYYGGHDVTFLNYDGSIFIRQTVNNGGILTKPANNPFRDGYSFVSWKVNGIDFDFSTRIYGEITLTPSWQILVHTVRFLDERNGTEIGKVYVNHGSKVTPLTNPPTKPGYVFKAWYLGDYEFNFNNDVYENTTLYATYNQEFYYVKFLDYDGTLLKEYNNISYGGSVSSPTKPNNKVGHVFSMWDKEFNNVKENLVITAVYKKIEYFVYFYDYDGSMVTTYLVPYDEYANQPTLSKREGHTFAGWLLNGVLFDFNTKITEEISLYASWDIEYFNVTFISQGITVATYNLAYGSYVTKPTVDPTREGYTFAGWYSSGRIYNFEETVKSDLDLTAGWSSVGYTVSFLNPDGTTFKTTTVEPNTPVIKPESSPVKEGYTFDSWMLGDLIYPFNLPVNSNLVLTPSFNIIKYTVNFLDADSSIINSIKVDHGSKIAKPTDPEKTGYTFSGWYLGDIIYDFNSSVYDPIDLVARWSINSYRVRFFDGQTLLKTENVNYQKDATPPVVPEKEGYTFTGWDISYKNITKNTDINANYEVSKYTVIFKDHEKIIKTSTITHGKNASAPEATFREGYTFTGWDKEYTNVTKDLTVNAIYERIKLTVKYYGFYDNILKVESVYYGDYLTPPLAPLIEEGIFNSWLLDALTEYNVNLPVKTDLNLYAYYDIFEYTVKFINYDGSVLKTEEVSHGNPATPPVNPTREGYLFAGWNKDYSVIKDNTDILARYIKEGVKTYTVTFINEDNTVIKEELVNENEKAIKPADPVKPGYSFVNWLIDGTVYDFNTNVTKNITLTASYLPIIYQVIYRDKDIIATIDVSYEQTITVPEVPVKNGYNGVWEVDLENVKIKTNYDIKAVYTLIDYTITYHNVRDGVNNNPSTHTLLDVVILEDLISNDNSNGFIGWYDEFDNQVLFLAGAGDKEVYAKWVINEYVVKFLDHLGEVISLQTITHGEKAVEPNVSLREHYNHIGWDKTFSNVRSDLIINALYAPKEYTLTYNNEGVTTVDFITYPNLPIKKTDPEKIGHSFVGWYKDTNFNELFNFNEPLKGNIEVYAKFKKNVYLVTFVDDKGSVVEQISVNYGDNVKPTKIPLKEHYTFVGWDKPLNNITKNELIKAIFEANSYILSFETFGGNLINEEVCQYPETPTMPLTPTKEGYDFVGWFTDNNYTTKFNFNVPLVKDVRVYARWLEKLDDNKYISMYQTAAIRYKTKESSQGLRFYARINEDVKNNEHGFYLIYGNVTVEELRLAKNGKNKDESFLINGKKVFKVIVGSVDENNTYSVVLTGIPAYGYIDNLSAIAYVLVDGEEHFTLEATTRSVAEVAFKNLNNGEKNNSLLDLINEIEQKIVYSENMLGDIELNNNYFEYNQVYLKEEFKKDFIEVLQKEYSNLDIEENDLKAFYNNSYLKDKWLFMLDYFLSLSSSDLLNEQINNIKNSKNNSSLKELTYAFNNFFNEENSFVKETIIDFTNYNNYLTLKNFNNKIYINPNNYKLYKVGEEIELKEVTNELVGYVFEHYLIAGNLYNPLDKYVVTNASVTFKKVYKATNLSVTFIADGAEYYKKDVNAYETLLELPVINKVGYNFIGWFTIDDKIYNINTEITKSFTLIAKFEKINYVNVVDVYIDKLTYKVISHSENINVLVYYDYNYVDVKIIPIDDYEFSFDVIINIYFNNTKADVVNFTVSKSLIYYVLNDPNYTKIY